MAGLKVQGHIIVEKPIEIMPFGSAKRLTIGADSFFNTGVRFACADSSITIGSRVQVGPRVSFETMNHGLIKDALSGRGSTTQPIVVEDDARIGVGAIILPGVRIGRGSVVAAGAVVTLDVSPFTLVSGIPARFTKDIARLEVS